MKLFLLAITSLFISASAAANSAEEFSEDFADSMEWYDASAEWENADWYESDFDLNYRRDRRDRYRPRPRPRPPEPRPRTYTYNNPKMYFHGRAYNVRSDSGLAFCQYQLGYRSWVVRSNSTTRHNETIARYNHSRGWDLKRYTKDKILKSITCGY